MWKCHRRSHFDARHKHPKTRGSGATREDSFETPAGHGTARTVACVSDVDLRLPSKIIRMLSLRHSESSLLYTIFLDHWSFDSKLKAVGPLFTYRNQYTTGTSSTPTTAICSYFHHEVTLHNSQTTDDRSSMDSFDNDIAESGTERSI